jgi:hypothetical protein
LTNLANYVVGENILSGLQTEHSDCVDDRLLPTPKNYIYSEAGVGKMSAVSETLIFSLVDAGCLVLFLLYSRCFFSCEKLLRKEEAQRWLEGLKGVVMALLLFALSGWKAALWSIAVVAPIGLSIRFLFGAKFFGKKTG